MTRYDYLNTGLKVECREDLERFVREHIADLTVMENDGGEKYAVLDAGGDVEYYFNCDEDGRVYPFSMEVLYSEGRETVLADCRPVTRELMAGFLTEGELRGAPIHIYLPEAVCFADARRTKKERLRVSFSLTAAELQYSEGERGPLEALDKEAYIPCGTFPFSAKDEGWEPSELVIFSGVVCTAERRVNALTGLGYWVLAADCLGMTFTVLAGEDQLPEEPKPGAVISGVFRANGRITDDCSDAL